MIYLRKSGKIIITNMKFNMIYLKNFNESIGEDLENRKKINEDINDILLELTDIGIKVELLPYFISLNKNSKHYKYQGHLSSINITGKTDNGMVHCIEWPDVKDCVLRLKDYLGDKFIEFNYTGVYKNGTLTKRIIVEDLNENSGVMFDIYSFSIIYKKI